MKRLQFKWQIGLFLSFVVLITIACKEDIVKEEIVVHEIFDVKGDDNTKKPTVLRFKVAQIFVDEMMTQQSFYHVDNTLKSYELIKKDGNKGMTNYYSADSVLLAIYNLEFQGENIKKRTGYDGQTKELLRIEILDYNPEGELIKKSIQNETGILSSYFVMQYDADGNEVNTMRYNASDKVLDEENFVVEEKNERGEWTKRWGYKNGQPSSFHRRSFSN